MLQSDAIMSVVVGPATLGPVGDGLPLDKVLLLQRPFGCALPPVAVLQHSIRSQNGPEVLCKPLGAERLLAKVEAQGENKTTGHRGEWTIAAAVWERRNIRVSLRPSVVSAM